MFLREPAPLDNNLVERALKKAILRRRNSLFYKPEFAISATKCAWDRKHAQKRDSFAGGTTYYSVRRACMGSTAAALRAGE